MPPTEHLVTAWGEKVNGNFGGKSDGLVATGMAETLTLNAKRGYGNSLNVEKEQAKKRQAGRKNEGRGQLGHFQAAGGYDAFSQHRDRTHPGGSAPPGQSACYNNLVQLRLCLVVALSVQASLAALALRVKYL